jgi:hypothetical protein
MNLKQALSIKEADMNEAPVPPSQKADHTVAILTIVATALVLLACIAGCTGVLVAAITHIH